MDLDWRFRQRGHGASLMLMALATSLFATGAVRAGGDDGGNARDRIEAAIEACWAASRADLDSSVTSQMRHGAAVAAACLEDVLQAETRGLLTADTYSRLDLHSQLEALRSSYQAFYWELYNGGRRGRGLRGTVYQTFHLGRYTGLLENMIRDVATERDSPY